MNEQNENFYLTQTPVKKLLLRFSVPCVLAMIVSALYNIVDQIFIGNSVAGTAGIMATTLVFPFTVVALSLGQLIGDGCASLFSLSLGAKDKETSNKAVGNAIVSVIVAGLLLVIFGLIFTNPILKLLGINGYNETCQLFTKQYFIIILCGTPFYMFASAMASVIRASGAPGYSMISTIFGAIINLIMDPILIFGFNLGIQGAAIATILGQIVSAILCGLYFKNPKLISVSKEIFKIDFVVLKKLFKLGISSLITQLSIAVITIVANNVVGKIGGEYSTDAGGALGIVFKIFAIVLAFSLGVAVGGQPIIGFNYGAKKYNRVLETYRLIVIANIIIGLVSMALFELVPNAIVGLFGGNANNIEFYKDFAAASFRIYLGGILLCCIQKSSCIFLQSIDKPFKAMILSLMRDVVLLVPGVCLFGLLSNNLYVMLISGPVADIGSFIVTVILVGYEIKKIKKLSAEEVIENNDVIKEKDNDYKKDDKFIISIGREFGSGGKYIGEELSKRLHINCYDGEILKKVSEKYNIDKDTLDKVDEKQKESFWYSFAINNNLNNNDDDEHVEPISAEDNLFLKTAKVIEEIAEQENCIIIGRCSNYILKDNLNLISIFIYSKDINFKISRKKEYEKISENEAKKKILKIDKERSNYYNHYTSQTWGDKSNYDITVDSSKLGIEKTIDLLEDYIYKIINDKK